LFLVVVAGYSYISYSRCFILLYKYDFVVYRILVSKLGKKIRFFLSSQGTSGPCIDVGRSAGTYEY